MRVIALLTAISGGISVLGWGVVLGAGGHLFLVLGALNLYIAWALWNLKSWAWTLLVALTAIGLMVSMFGMSSSWPWLIVNAVVLFYLFRPEVKSVFRRT